MRIFSLLAGLFGKSCAGAAAGGMEQSDGKKATAEAKVIERADYMITVSGVCTVDPEDSDIDLDYMTTINLPNKTRCSSSSWMR